MATAIPLPLTPLPATEDVDFVVADDAYVAGLPPEVRAAIESAEARIAAGTAQLASHAEVVRAIEERRVTALAVGDR